MEKFEGTKMIDAAVKVLYVVEVIEYERGWGQRPDGYICFLNEAVARAFTAAEYEKRLKETTVPEAYDHYEHRGYLKCCAVALERAKTSKRGYIYIDKLHELMNYDINKYMA